MIGRVFWPSAVAAVGATDPESVRLGLHELAHRELVRPVRVSCDPGRHGVRVRARPDPRRGLRPDPRLGRVDKHVAAAEWIERMAAERLSDRAELLAHHYGQALELSRAAGSEAVDALGASTRRALMMAGENAMTLDVSRATVCFDEVLALLPADHPERASALYFKAEAVKDAGRYEEAERGYREAISAFREIGDRVGEGAGLTKLANVLWERGSLARAASASPRRWRSSSPNPRRRPGHVFRVRGVGPDRRGVVLGRDRLVRPRARAGHQARRRMARVSGAQLPGRGTVLPGGCGRPRPSAAGARGGRGHGSSREHALALLVRAEVEWATEGPVVALETVREGGDLAERRGLMDMELWFDALSLEPLFDVGAWDELLQVADDVLRRSQEAGGDYAAGLAQPWLTQVLLWRGRPAEAADAAAESMTRSANIRDAQILVPAEVAAALVAVREGREQDAIRIVEELEREAEVSLDWYRENFLADLVRSAPRPAPSRSRGAWSTARRSPRDGTSSPCSRPGPRWRRRSGTSMPRAVLLRAGRRGLDRVAATSSRPASRCSARAAAAPVSATLGRTTSTGGPRRSSPRSGRLPGRGNPGGTPR